MYFLGILTLYYISHCCCLCVCAVDVRAMSRGVKKDSDLKIGKNARHGPFKERFKFRIIRKVGGSLTVHYGLSIGTVVVDLLDVPEVDVAEEDAVSPLAPATAVVKSERDHVLHVFGILEWFDGRIQVVFVRQVNTLQNGPLRVQQIPVVLAAALPVFR